MAIVIDLKLNTRGQTSALTRVERRLQAIEDRIDSIKAKFDQAANSAGRFAAVLGSISRFSGSGMRVNLPASISSPRGGGSGTRMADAYDQFRYMRQINAASGGQHRSQLMASAQAAQNMLLPLANQGNAGAIGKLGNVQGAILRMQQQQQANSPMNRMRNLIFSTRLNFGGKGGFGASPLVGRAMQALGPVFDAIPGKFKAIALAAAAIPVAFAALVSAAQSAAASIKAAYAGRAAAGGSASEFGRLSGFARILGTDPKDLALGIAEAVQDGMGAAYASKLGISTVGGPFGDTNSTGKALKVLTDIANSSTLEQARQKAMMVGNPDLAQLQQLSPQQKKLLTESMFGPNEKGVTAAKDFTAVLDRFGVAMERLKNSRGAVFIMERLTGIFDWVLTRLNAFIDGLDKLGGWLESISQWVGGVSGSKSGKSGNSSIDRNTRALERNTSALNGTFGGGQRAAGAMPRGINGWQLGDASVRHALGTGVI